MHDTDRHQFESELGVLFGGFPTFLTPPRIEAYWRGLQKMQMSTFKRCIEQVLGESGQEKLPTVNTLWQISKRLRAVSANPQKQVLPVIVHPLQRVANGAMLKLLHDKGPASDEALAKIIALKNRIVSQSPEDADHGELRDVVLAAIEKLWEPMSAEAVAAHIARRFPQFSPAALAAATTRQTSEAGSGR